MSECYKTHNEGPSENCPWCRIDALQRERDEAVALLREIVAWRVAIECVAPELGGVATTLSRIDAFLAPGNATHRETPVT